MSRLIYARTPSVSLYQRLGGEHDFLGVPRLLENLFRLCSNPNTPYEFEMYSLLQPLSNSRSAPCFQVRR